MKKIKGFLAVVVAVVVLCMTTCGGYSPAKEYKNVELNGLKIDVRSDMVFDDSQKDAAGQKIEQYYCDYFGVMVVSEPVAVFKQNGCESVSDYLNAVIDANNFESAVEVSGDKVYIDYTSKVKDVEFAYTAYGLELGYNYYMIQFFAKSGEEDLYRDEYNKIVDSAKLAQTPPETKEIVISGVKMTVGGDVQQLNDNQYYSAEYFISVVVSQVDVTAQNYAKALIEGGQLTDADGKTPAIVTSDDGIASFESVSDDQYVYNYVRIVDGKMVYVVFSTNAAADDALKAEFYDIVKSAVLV